MPSRPRMGIWLGLVLLVLGLHSVVYFLFRGHGDVVFNNTYGFDVAWAADQMRELEALEMGEPKARYIEGKISNHARVQVLGSTKVTTMGYSETQDVLGGLGTNQVVVVVRQNDSMAVTSCLELLQNPKGLKNVQFAFVGTDPLTRFEGSNSFILLELGGKGHGMLVQGTDGGVIRRSSFRHATSYADPPKGDYYQQLSDKMSGIHVVGTKKAHAESLLEVTSLLRETILNFPTEHTSKSGNVFHGLLDRVMISYPKWLGYVLASGIFIAGLAPHYSEIYIVPTVLQLVALISSGGAGLLLVFILGTSHLELLVLACSGIFLLAASLVCMKIKGPHVHGFILVAYISTMVVPSFPSLLLFAFVVISQLPFWNYRGWVWLVPQITISVVANLLTMEALTSLSDPSYLSILQISFNFSLPILPLMEKTNSNFLRFLIFLAILIATGLNPILGRSYPLAINALYLNSEYSVSLLGSKALSHFHSHGFEDPLPTQLPTFRLNPPTYLPTNPTLLASITLVYNQPIDSTRHFQFNLNAHRSNQCHLSMVNDPNFQNFTINQHPLPTPNFPLLLSRDNYGTPWILNFIQSGSTSSFKIQLNCHTWSLKHLSWIDPRFSQLQKDTNLDPFPLPDPHEDYLHGSFHPIRAGYFTSSSILTIDG